MTTRDDDDAHWIVTVPLRIAVQPRSGRAEAFTVNLRGRWVIGDSGPIEANLDISVDGNPGDLRGECFRAFERGTFTPADSHAEPDDVEGEWFRVRVEGQYRGGETDQGGYFVSFPRLAIVNATSRAIVANIAYRQRVGDTFYYATDEHRCRIGPEDYEILQVRFDLGPGNVRKAGGLRAMMDGQGYIRVRDEISGHEEKHPI